LLAEKHEVVVYDNLSQGHRDSVPKEAELVVGDVSDRKALDRLFSSRAFDGVLHLAALIDAGESMRVPELYFRGNTAATLTLLDAMLAAGINKLVFSSTAALYGEPENIPIRESDTLKPTNVYGESKLLVERVLEWLNRIHGFRYASLRYFNAAGATKDRGERHHPESHLIPLVLQAAVGQRPSISIFGLDYPTPDGTCVRDYIHVLDLARAHILALEALNHHDKLIYNLGNGRGFSVREVIKVAERVTKNRIPVVEAPRRPGDPAILVASSEKIQKELHWKPQHPDLEEIIASAWSYLQLPKN
jgi:UDP-glucose 4-epimerase